MLNWMLLAVAICAEVSATLALTASQGFRKKKWLPVVLAGYCTSFSMLWLILENGMPLGIAYAIWAAVGVALTAIMGRVLFKDRTSRVSAVGIAVIICGVVLIELGTL